MNPEKLVALAQVLSTTTDYLMGLSDAPGTIEPVRGGGEDTKQDARDDTPAPPRHRPRSKRPKTEAQE
jgi:hypothetical protein